MRFPNHKQMENIWNNFIASSDFTKTFQRIVISQMLFNNLIRLFHQVIERLGYSDDDVQQMSKEPIDFTNDKRKDCEDNRMSYGILKCSLLTNTSFKTNDCIFSRFSVQLSSAK
jgi:hypothetical protein